MILGNEMNALRSLLILKCDLLVLVDGVVRSQELRDRGGLLGKGHFSCDIFPQRLL